MKIRKSKRGFTLIEIMLVIVIIGIIVGIAGPKVMKNLGKSTEVGAKGSLNGIETAIELYQMDHLQLPSSLTDLTTIKDGKGPYLKPSELKDPWGNQFQYSKPGSHSIGYDLSTTSPDGKSFNNWE